MTFCKTLASKKCGRYEVEAEECIEKYSSVPYYHILVCDGCVAFQVIPTARTTWRKKFKEVCAEYE